MDVRRRHLHAPVVDIGLRRRHKPHVTIDARARVPAAVLLLRVIDTDHNLIAPYINIRCSIHPERGVAIRPPTSLVPIDIDTGVHIDALEIEAYLLPCIGLAKCQRTTIPALTRSQIGSVVACRGIDVETMIDAPIVGQDNTLCLRKVTVVLYKLPLVVEQLFALKRSCLSHDGYGCHKHNSHHHSGQSMKNNHSSNKLMSSVYGLSEPVYGLYISLQ